MFVVRMCTVYTQLEAIWDAEVVSAVQKAQPFKPVVSSLTAAHCERDMNDL